MKRIISILLAVIIAISTISFSFTALAASDDNVMKVTYYYVGNGDCAFIEFPLDEGQTQRETILIDSGLQGYYKEDDENRTLAKADEKKYIDNVVSSIKAKGYDTISYVVETHPHFDHIAGMTTILSEFEIGTYYRPNVITATQTFDNTIEMLDNLEKEPIYLEKGMVLDDSDLYDVTCLSPSKINEFDDDLYNSNKAKMDSLLNDDSVVLKIKYKDNSFLFTGDIERTVEAELVKNYGSDLKCDVLKLPHHGSTTSSTPEFLSAVSPTYTVISCGINNKYGHPYNATLKKLLEIKTRIFRTNFQPIGKNNLPAPIEFKADGKNISTSAVESDFPASTRAVNSIYRINDSLTISWDKDFNATGYYVFKSEGGSYKKVATIEDLNVTSYTDYGLTPGKKYYYKVQSYNGFSTSNDSNSVTGVIPLATPTGVVVTRNGPKSLKITWTAVQNASGYQIYRATSANGNYTLVSTVADGKTTSFKNYELTTGKNYYYKVVAYGQYVEALSEASAYSYAKPAPLKPTNVKLTKKNSTSINISWKKVTGATGYAIYRSTSKNGKYTKVATTKSTSFTNKKLKSKKTYYYKVRAYKTVKSKNVYGDYSSIVKKKLK